MARTNQSKEIDWVVQGTVGLSVAGFLFLFLAGSLLPSGRSSQVMRRNVCAKKLSDIYKILDMYANASLEEMGGDGLYPDPHSTPEVFFQTLVEGGFLKDPQQVCCPSQGLRKVYVSYKHGSNNTRPYFDLTEKAEVSHYGSPREALSNEDEDPDLVITGDRWDHRALRKRGWFGSWKDESTIGRNFLFAHGKVVFVKRGDDRYHGFRGQIWE